MAQKPQKFSASPEAQARVPLTAPARALAPEPEAEAADAGPRKTSTRVPMGRAAPKMDYPKRPGFNRRWFNDMPGRIQRAVNAGYAHVTSADGRNVSMVVGKHERGLGMTAYLMEIPEEFFNDDFAAKEESLDERDKQIYGGTFQEEQGDRRYVPKGGISMKVDRGPGVIR